jgi:4'-phosphopantetheinyl transferase
MVAPAAPVSATPAEQTPASGVAAAVSTGVSRLQPGDVHVWHIPLLPLAHRAERLRALLSPVERDAERRLHFEHDRTRFVCRRGAVRSILSLYAGIPAHRLRFRTGSHGKPELGGAAALSGVRFNVSHSCDLALCAVTAGRRIGVDVEVVKVVTDLERIAALFFSRAEREALSTIPAGERPLAFLRCWTRKEAFLKARGDGLSYPLQGFDVSLRPGEPAALLRLGRDRAARRRWSMTSFDPCDGYVAALAVGGPDCHVCWWARFGEVA